MLVVLSDAEFITRLNLMKHGLGDEVKTLYYSCDDGAVLPKLQARLSMEELPLKVKEIDYEWDRSFVYVQLTFSKEYEMIFGGIGESHQWGILFDPIFHYIATGWWELERGALGFSPEDIRFKNATSYDGDMDEYL